MTNGEMRAFLTEALRHCEHTVILASETRRIFKAHGLTELVEAETEAINAAEAAMEEVRAEALRLDALKSDAPYTAPLTSPHTQSRLNGHPTT